MTGIMTNAGALVDGKITDKTFKVFCDDVQTELQKGTDGLNLPIPCGLNIPPSKNPELYEGLSDPKKFPDFHANWRPRYEEMIKSFDIEGNMPFFPICDPTALAIKFDLKLDMDLPEIMLKIALGPALLAELPNLLPDLALKLTPPNLPKFTAKLIAIPPPMPKISIPIQLPTFDTKFELDLEMIKFPLAAFKIMIGKFPDIPTLPPTFDGLIKLSCEVVHKAMTLPPYERNDTLFVAKKTLARHAATKVLPCVFAGCTVGNGGLVKAMGAAAGFDPSPDPPPPPKKMGGGRGILYKFEPASHKLLSLEEAKKKTYVSQATGKKTRHGIPVIRLEDTSEEFRDQLIESAENIGIDPNWLVAMISNESASTYHPQVIAGFVGSEGKMPMIETNVDDPGLGNKKDSKGKSLGGESVGIMQWENFIMGLLQNPSKQLQDRGVKPSDINRKKLLSITATEQLKYVEEWFNFVRNQNVPPLEFKNVVAVAIAVNASSPQNISAANNNPSSLITRHLDKDKKILNPKFNVAASAAASLYNAAKQRGFIE